MRRLWPELWEVFLPDLDEFGRRDLAAFERRPVDFLPHLPKPLEWADKPMPFHIQIQCPGWCSRHLQGGDLLRPIDGIAWRYLA